MSSAVERTKHPASAGAWVIVMTPEDQRTLIGCKGLEVAQRHEAQAVGRRKGVGNGVEGVFGTVARG